MSLKLPSVEGRGPPTLNDAWHIDRRRHCLKGWVEHGSGILQEHLLRLRQLRQERKLLMWHLRWHARWLTHGERIHPQGGRWVAAGHQGKLQGSLWQLPGGACRLRKLQRRCRLLLGSQACHLLRRGLRLRLCCLRRQPAPKNKKFNPKIITSESSRVCQPFFTGAVSGSLKSHRTKGDILWAPTE